NFLHVGWQTANAFAVRYMQAAPYGVQQQVIFVENVNSGSPPTESSYTREFTTGTPTSIRIHVGTGADSDGDHDTGGKYAYLTSIRMYGNGVNPYGLNNCNFPTPTPTATATITATQFNTITPLPTSTLAPTYTPMATSTLASTVTPLPTPGITPTTAPDPMDDENTFTSDGNCTNYGGTEPTSDANGTWTEWLFGGFTNLVECSILATRNFVVDAINQVRTTLLTIFNFMVTTMASWIYTIISEIQSIFNLIATTIRDTLNAIWIGINAIFQFMIAFLRDKL